ncbi:MAG: 50S ribosomal protein L18e [Candidatus Altiarchaeota archaeon]|nr:50S ribosomal protein L18e [Candidatus Altiarchaeota archaeon]
MLRKRILKRNFEDPRIGRLLVDLSKSKSKFWFAVGKRLSAPRRERIAVNVSQLRRNIVGGETVVVPGKLLGAGEIDRKVTVAAYQFSETAVEKIKAASGKVMLIEELLDKDKVGKKLKMVI